MVGSVVVETKTSCKRNIRRGWTLSTSLNVLYEEVVARDQEQEVDLKQNEAHGPLRPQ